MHFVTIGTKSQPAAHHSLILQHSPSSQEESKMHCKVLNLLRSHSTPPHYTAPISLSGNICICTSIAHHCTHSHLCIKTPVPLPYLNYHAHQALYPYVPTHMSWTWTSSIISCICHQPTYHQCTIISLMLPSPLARI